VAVAVAVAVESGTTSILQIAPAAAQAVYVVSPPGCAVSPHRASASRLFNRFEAMVLNDVNQITDRWHLVRAEPVLGMWIVSARWISIYSVFSAGLA